MKRLMGLVSKGLSKVPAFNYYKAGLYLALFLGWSTLVYQHAKNECEQDYLEQQAELAEKQAEETIEEVNTRVPVVLERDKESAALRAELKRIKGELDVALNQREDNPACALSDAELDGFRKLSAKTRD